MSADENGTVEIAWEDPPQSWRASKWDAAIEAVKKRPGQWARVGVWPNGTSQPYGARKVIRKREPDERLEAVVIRIDAETHGLWLRWRTPEQVEAQIGWPS
jgi:hypothetical protein